MKKFNKKYLYYLILKTSCIVLFCGLVFIVRIMENNINNEQILMLVICFLAAIVLGAIYCILYWNKTTYEVNDEGIIVCKGVLLKKKTILKYERMHAIDRKQGLIQKLFNIESLSVDSGATQKALLPEVTIYGNKEEIDEIFTLVNSKSKNSAKNIEVTSTNEGIYDFSWKRKIVFCSIYVITLALLALIAVAIIEIALLILQNLVIDTSDIAFFIIIFVVAIAIIELFSVAILALTMYNFQVVKNDKSINVKYGLFVKVSNTIHYDKIKAVKVDYGFIKRFFGLASIKIEAVGFGANEQGQNNNVVIPSCKKSEVNQYLEKLLPEYMLKENILTKPKEKTLRFFIFLPMLISSIIIASIYGIVMVAIEKYYFIVSICFLTVYLVFELLIFLFAIIEKGNMGVSIGEDKIYIHNGYIIKKITIIDFKNIIGIERIDTYNRFKVQTSSYVIHYFNNAYTNTERIKMFDNNLENELENIVKY